MKKHLFHNVLIAAAGLLIFISSAISAEAQIGARIPIGAAVRTPRPAGGGSTPRRTVVIRTNTQRVVVKETVRVNYLAVTTEPGAKVLVEPKKAGGYRKEIVANSGGLANFEAVPPGAYKVTASKAGFDTEVNDQVTVSAQKGQALPLELEAIKYKLKLSTNLRAGGEVFYALKDTKTPGGSDSIADREGDYCVVKVKPNGDAQVDDLQEGDYFIDIRPSAAELQYDELKIEIKVPADLEQGGDAPFDIALAAKISTQPFGATWSQAEWSMPGSFRLDKGMKIRNAEGVALPQNTQFRNYTNFGLNAYAKLNDDGVLGFALRALDDKNYYLLQITGAKALEPHRATLFAVKNGVPKALDSRTLAPFAKTLASDKGFSIYVEAAGSAFTVRMEDNETGAKQPVGVLNDQSTSFRKGAIGIVGSANSNFEIKEFLVCPNKCDQ